MSVTIAHTDIADLCAGSVFLATGGGGDPYVSQILVQQSLKKYGAVSLVPLGDVPDDAYVVAIGEVVYPVVRDACLYGGVDVGKVALVFGGVRSKRGQSRQVRASRAAGERDEARVTAVLFRVFPHPLDGALQIEEVIRECRSASYMVFK